MERLNYGTAYRLKLELGPRKGKLVEMDVMRDSGVELLL